MVVKVRTQECLKISFFAKKSEILKGAFPPQGPRIYVNPSSMFVKSEIVTRDGAIQLVHVQYRFGPIPI